MGKFGKTNKSGNTVFADRKKLMIGSKSLTHIEFEYFKINYIFAVNQCCFLFIFSNILLKTAVILFKSFELCSAFY